MQFNGDHATDMHLLNGKRTCSSYSQLGWIMHYLQNLLTRSTVILSLIPISMVKVAIEKYCLQIYQIFCQSTISGTSQNMSQLNVRDPSVLPSAVATETCMECIAVTKA